MHGFVSFRDKNDNIVTSHPLCAHNNDDDDDEQN